MNTASRMRRAHPRQQRRSDRPADHRAAPVKGDGLAGFLGGNAEDAVIAHDVPDQREGERRVAPAPHRIGMEEEGHLRADGDLRADIKEDREAAEQRPARGQGIAHNRDDSAARDFL